MCYDRSMSTRSDALAAGQVTYSTGKPCKRGHLGPRYAINGTCLLCMGNAPPVRPLTLRLTFEVPTDRANEVTALVGYLLGGDQATPRGDQYLGRPLASDCTDPYYTAEGVPYGTKGDGKNGPAGATRTSHGWSN